jgi:RNA-directed DNA polymerase
VADTARKNTDTRIRGGATRSSAEASVMGVERRGGVIRRVKANRGAAGIDNESIEMFEADLKGNLYRCEFSFKLSFFTLRMS